MSKKNREERLNEGILNFGICNITTDIIKQIKESDVEIYNVTVKHSIDFIKVITEGHIKTLCDNEGISKDDEKEMITKFSESLNNLIKTYTSLDINSIDKRDYKIFFDNFISNWS